MSVFFTLIFVLFSFSCRTQYSEDVSVNMSIPANCVGCEAWLVKQNITDNYISSVNDSVNFSGFSAPQTRSDVALSSVAAKEADEESIVRIDVQAHSPEFLARVDPDIVRYTDTHLNRSVYGSSSAGNTYLIPNISRGNSIKLEEEVCTVLAENEICRILIDDRVKNNNTEDDIAFSRYHTDDLSQLKTDASSLANSFKSKVYPGVTALMGDVVAKYSDVKGESMPDSTINIFITDINRTGSRSSGTLGFFYTGDFYYSNTASGTPWGNKALCFYIDYLFWKYHTDIMISTLAHEFTHMVNHSQKVSLHGNNANDTWWTELLAMVAEDALAEELFGNDRTNSPQTVRCEDYIKAADNLHVPLAQWATSNSELMLAYGTCYMMGAFLARNFGGGQLINNVATNKECGSYESWDVALAECRNNETGKTSLREALAEFPIALIASSHDNGGRDQNKIHKYSFFRESGCKVGGKEFVFEPLPEFSKPTRRFSLPHDGYMYPYDFHIEELGVVTSGSEVIINNMNKNVSYRLIFRDDDGKFYTSTHFQ